MTIIFTWISLLNASRPRCIGQPRTTASDTCDASEERHLISANTPDQLLTGVSLDAVARKGNVADGLRVTLTAEATR